MSLLSTLKSLLGLDGGDREPRRRETDVTVERTGDSDGEAADGAAVETEPSVDGEAGDAERDDSSEASVDDGTPVEEIKGIGPAYADQLAGAEVHTVADLLAADPEAIEDQTSVSAKRVRTWLDRAEEVQD